MICFAFPNNVKLGTLLALLATTTFSKTAVKFKIHQTNGSRDM